MKNEENNILFVFKYFRWKQRLLFTYLFFISKVTLILKMFTIYVNKTLVFDGLYT